jgi:peptidoglycan hydrolase CwlO-like protein
MGFSAFFKKTIFIFLLSAFAVLPAFIARAQENEFPEICESLEKVDERCRQLSDKECRELLEKCQSYFEEKSLQIAKDITKTEEEKRTLQGQINSLTGQIQQLEYQIYQSSLIIKDLGFQIKDTESSIGKTADKIGESSSQLILILRKIYEEDQKSLPEIFLAEENFSDFFSDLVALESLSVKNKELLETIKELKNYLQKQKQSLDSEKLDYENLMAIHDMQRQENEGIKQERKYFLEMTEAEYQKYLGEKEETDLKVSEITSRLFALIGVKEGGIEFGQAVEIAKYAEAVVGIRPAFLLAVIAQESMRYEKFGGNVGQCYLPESRAENIQKRIMAPGPPTTTRNDVACFLEITKELGRDPYNTPVSCPMSYGWGGAMGPAQFIPSTWAIYKNNVKAITGKPADPWNIKDAFLAAAIYLTDSGAAKRTYDAEFNAALSYFAGPYWYNSAYKEIYKRDYGYPVMNRAQSYQKDIEKLEKAG